MLVVITTLTVQSERTGSVENPGYGRQGWRLRNRWDRGKGTQRGPSLAGAGGPVEAALTSTLLKLGTHLAH